MAEPMTLAEWRAEGERRFGPDMKAWRFVCPVCGGSQSGYDFKALPDADQPKRIEDVVFFSCIGRWMPKAPEAFATRRGARAKIKPTPGSHCNYTNGGLFDCAKLSVISESGKHVSVFEFAVAGQPGGKEP
jgi:hypothetical protein